MKSLANAIIFITCVYLAFTQVFPRVFALFHEAHNATVILDGCESQTCHLKGTLTTDPVTLDAVLISDDGVKHYISQEQIAITIIPQEKTE